MKNILIRADSSSTIGTGHIMRDLVLAKQFSGDNIIFATQELPGNINYKIKESDYKIEILQNNTLQELERLIEKCKINMLVIDHYGINYNFEKKLKEKYPHLILFVFDDTYEKHYCDILLNHNLSADRKKYTDLVPQECELRCGSKYTLLRDEFTEIKKRYTPKRKTKEKTVFIAMGGADTANLNIKILEVLQQIPNLQVNMVTTSANKNLNKLQKYCKNKSWIHLHINSNEIAKLMHESDFSIVTPSVTVNEAHFLNLPMIAIKTAENQRDIYNYLQKHNYPVIDKFNKHKLKRALKQLLTKRLYEKY